MTLPLISKPSVLTAVLLSAVALAACGESAQEKAVAHVCSSRSDISKQVTKLQGLAFSANTITEARAGFEAIGKDLTKIRSEQSALAPARREQVQAATNTFEKELSSIAASLVSSLGSGNLEAQLRTAQPQLNSALSKLAADSRQALGPISCP